jgi:hydroxymethylbilane synthase
MNMEFRVGTRNSQLALRQSELVVSALQRQAPDAEFAVTPIVTAGDRNRGGNLQVIGGKGVFVKDIERELLERRIDIAAHSLKDVQPVLPDSLTLGCFLPRDNPFDCLISPYEIGDFSQIPHGARIGTNSMRRQGQLLHRRPDLQIVAIRGNIETRLHKIETEHLDAVVLAQAGLRRLGLDRSDNSDSLHAHGLHMLSLEQVLLPAAGQGIIAVECRATDERTRELLALADDRTTRIAATIEREFMRQLGGSCSFPIGAWAHEERGTMMLRGMVASLDGTHEFTAEASSNDYENDYESLAARVASSLIDDGALALIEAASASGPVHHK